MILKLNFLFFFFNLAKYCLTPQCINVASSMLTAMNTQVSPCDDFYGYACGGWINQNPLPVSIIEIKLKNFKIKIYILPLHKDWQINMG